MKKPIPIFTAIIGALALGCMFAYRDIQKYGSDFQAHPMLPVVILTDFFGASLAVMFFYFVSRLLYRRKEKKLQKTGDVKFYEEVARELQEKPMFPGLWTKAFSEMGGDDAKARALYIKYRVAQLAETSGQELEKDRLAKQQQERPKRVRKIKIIFAVFILGAIFVWIAVQVARNNRSVFDEQKELAEKGDADAAYFLGLQYLCGSTNNGVAKDYAEAFKWFSKAADQNHPEGEYELGSCYYYGQGVKEDDGEAVKWYRKSAEQGNRDAFYALGSCYENGVGVQKDEVEAYKWLSLAVSQHIGNARENLTNIEHHLTPEQIAKAKQLAAAFVPQKQK